MSETAVMPRPIKERGQREMPNQTISAPDSTITVDTVMSTLDNALDDLAKLDAKLADKMKAALDKTAMSIQSKRIATAMVQDSPSGVTAYIAIGSKVNTVAANIQSFVGVRTAVVVDNSTLSFTSTPEAAQQIAFAFPEMDVMKASAMFGGPHGAQPQKPTANEPSPSRREASARTAAARVEMQYASVPGVYGIKEAFGKVIVSCHRDLPISSKNHIRDLAHPFDVRFAHPRKS